MEGWRGHSSGRLSMERWRLDEAMKGSDGGKRETKMEGGLAGRQEKEV